MDRIWEWGWRRYRSRYLWFVFAVTLAVNLPMAVACAVLITQIEGASRYLTALGAALTLMSSAVFASVAPLSRLWRPATDWARGGETDPATALTATYRYSRRSVGRSAVTFVLFGAAEFAVVSAIAGARGARMLEYTLAGAMFQSSVVAIAIHNFLQASVRPVRLEIAAGTPIGDSLPKDRPSFATWSNVMVLAVAWAFTFAGAVFATAIGSLDEHPAQAAALASAMTVVFAAPITLGTAFSPSLRPIRDLHAGTERVRVGDYSVRVPVVQDNDLGALAASFNLMQAGLEERRRLESAFGAYVDPALATRLLHQADDVFTGERIDVTVLFVDIRDFTPFAEANSADDTMALLNRLFEIVVPAVLAAGGHLNKFLGDGALAVFGAPTRLARHADAAAETALRIRDLVEQQFGDALRIGIGINTGTVIAGTVGGAGKLEFTLIGDAVNVAARVEQLTKATDDVILLTEDTLAALTPGGFSVTDRGSHALKGKADPVHVYGLDGSVPPGSMSGETP